MHNTLQVAAFASSSITCTHALTVTCSFTISIFANADVSCVRFTFQILEDIDKWGIDVYRIAELSNSKPLTTVTYAIFMVSLHPN